MEKIQGDYPKVIALRDTVKSSKRIKAYAESGRRQAFNDYGIFRHYAELDEGADNEAKRQA